MEPAVDTLEVLLQEQEADRPLPLFRTWLAMMPGASAEDLRQAVGGVQARSELPLAQVARRTATLHRAPQFPVRHANRERIA